VEEENKKETEKRCISTKRIEKSCEVASRSIFTQFMLCYTPVGMGNFIIRAVISSLASVVDSQLPGRKGTMMRGYLLFHEYRDVQGYAVDKYEYDPFVWHTPYLLSFCHMNMPAGKALQRRHHPSEIVILGVTRGDAQSPFCCSLVFYVADKKPLSMAKAKFPLAQRHFEKGEQAHYEYYHAVPEHF
jgi:hypothetical protein